MTEIIIIAAVAKNLCIGKQGKMPWHISDDLKRFKRLTFGHPCIMGRKTFESLPIKPLPGRKNIILTSRKHLPYEDIELFDSLPEALRFCIDSNEKKVFLIGGASVYKEGLAYADRLYLTELEKTFEGDAFFPKIDPGEWILISDEPHEHKEYGRYHFKDYARIGSTETSS